MEFTEILGLTEIYAKTPGIGWNIDRDSDLAAGPMPMPPGIDIRSISFDRCLEQKDLGRPGESELVLCPDSGIVVLLALQIERCHCR